ncbi:MAG: hypothetical protein AAF202_04740 [Pseudomonadota bacterium]
MRILMGLIATIAMASAVQAFAGDGHEAHKAKDTKEVTAEKGKDKDAEKKDEKAMAKSEEESTEATKK